MVENEMSLFRIRAGFLEYCSNVEMRKVIEVLHFESVDLKHGLTELLPPPLCLRYSPIINA